MNITSDKLANFKFIESQIKLKNLILYIIHSISYYTLNKYAKIKVGMQL